MKLTFVHFRVFTRNFQVLGLADSDLRRLELEILNRPEAGVLIAGTGGARKLRFAPPSWKRGKSGSTRVCYVYFPDVSAVYLLAIYTKHDQDNLSTAEKASFRKVLENYRKWLKIRPGVLP